MLLNLSRNKKPLFKIKPTNAEYIFISKRLVVHVWCESKISLTTGLTIQVKHPIMRALTTCVQTCFQPRWTKSRNINTQIRHTTCCIAIFMSLVTIWISSHLSHLTDIFHCLRLWCAYIMFRSYCNNSDRVLV